MNSLTRGLLGLMLVIFLWGCDSDKARETARKVEKNTKEELKRLDDELEEELDVKLRDELKEELDDKDKESSSSQSSSQSVSSSSQSVSSEPNQAGADALHNSCTVDVTRNESNAFVQSYYPFNQDDPWCYSWCNVLNGCHPEYCTRYCTKQISTSPQYTGNGNTLPNRYYESQNIPIAPLMDAGDKQISDLAGKCGGEEELEWVREMMYKNHLYFEYLRDVDSIDKPINQQAQVGACNSQSDHAIAYFTKLRNSIEIPYSVLTGFYGESFSNEIFKDQYSWVACKDDDALQSSQGYAYSHFWTFKKGGIAQSAAYLRFNVFAEKSVFEPEFDREYDKLNAALSGSDDDDGILNALILDLRRNPGGFVDTQKAIARRIIGAKNASNTVFRYEQYNTDVEADNFGFYSPFGAPGHFDISKIIYLVDRDTDSASESLINVLHSYGFETYLIGEVTNGKPFMNTMYSNCDKNYHVVVARTFNRHFGGGFFNGLAPDRSTQMFQGAYPGCLIDRPNSTLNLDPSENEVEMLEGLKNMTVEERMAVDLYFDSAVRYITEGRCIN